MNRIALKGTRESKIEQISVQHLSTQHVSCCVEILKQESLRTHFRCSAIYHVSFSEGLRMSPIVRVLDDKVVQIWSLFLVPIRSVLLPVAANISSRSSQFIISEREWAVSVVTTAARVAPSVSWRHHLHQCWKTKTSSADSNRVHSPVFALYQRNPCIKCLLSLSLCLFFFFHLSVPWPS